MDLSIIIINYKTAKLVCDCLDSIYKSKTNYKYEIIVLDNNSQDNSKEVITKKYPRVKFIAEKTNHGFAKGNNLAAKKATGKYLLFLNSDTLVYKNTIQNSLSRIMKDEIIGILGCKILNRDKSLQRSVFRFPSTRLFLAELLFLPNLRLFNDYRYFKYDKEKHVDFVIGAFMLMPISLFKQLKAFDPDFFMYAEETDLCKRVHKLDKNVLFYPDAKIIHFGGASSNSNEIFRRIVKSKILFIKKHVFCYQITLFLLTLSNFIRFIFMVLSEDKRKKYGFLCREYMGEIFR